MEMSHGFDEGHEKYRERISELRRNIIATVGVSEDKRLDVVALMNCPDEDERRFRLAATMSLVRDRALEPEVNSPGYLRLTEDSERRVSGILAMGGYTIILE